MSTPRHARVVPNAFFESRVDTTDEWIRERTGIASRHFADPGIAEAVLQEDDGSGEVRGMRSAEVEQHAVAAGDRDDAHLRDGGGCLRATHDSARSR